MESKSPNIIAVGAVVAIVLGIVMAVAGPGTKFSNGFQYLTTGNTGNTTNNSQAPAGDYHAIARQDAIDNGIDPTLFTRQINQESGFNPNAVSPMGAIGIAQIMPSTAKGWGVDPWNATASLQAASKAMATYQSAYGSFEKALACYNAGTDTLDSAMAQYGSDWKTGLPAETQNYIKSIMGV